MHVMFMRIGEWKKRDDYQWCTGVSVFNFPLTSLSRTILFLFGYVTDPLLK